MDVQATFNLTKAFVQKYPVANMIYKNKTLILVAKRGVVSSSQQMALIIGMAFIGGLIAGFLVRCIYHNTMKYFTNMDNVQRPSRGQVNLSFVDDSFRHANDEPPDYITVIAVSPMSGVQDGNIDPCKERRRSILIPEENPPDYQNVVGEMFRVTRSSTT